jgi:hypothetical protein
MSEEFESTRTEEVMSYFKLLIDNTSEGTEEDRIV